MRLAAVFGLCVGLLSIAADDRGPRAVMKARRQAQTIAHDIAALRAENAMLRARAQALRHDARAIELEARNALGFARRGEIVVLRGR
jgi:cell division protein FtsB